MIVKTSRLPRRPNNERGAMLVFAAIVMVAVMGVLAMTLTVGAATRQRRIAQTSADAGSIAGSLQISRSKNNAAVVAAARSVAITNGFAASEITVNYPPATGPHSGNDDYVEVIINKTIATIFGSGSVLQRDSVTVRARAVAGLATPGMGCMIALGTVGKAIDVLGAINATDCGVFSNSSIDVRKNIDGPYVGAVGTVSGGPPGHTYEGIPPVSDPFMAVQLPTGADTVCTHTGLLQINNDTTIKAGVYCGGISIKKNITATLDSGIYFIRGGGLSGGEVKATPAVGGVTIILGNGVGNNPALYKPFSFENSCLFDLKAPTSGPYKGMAIITDPNAPSSGVNSINMFCGQGVINGTVYAPNQTFELVNSNGKLTITGMLVAKVITTENGGGQYEMKLDASGNSAVPKRPWLVE